MLSVFGNQLTASTQNGNKETPSTTMSSIEQSGSVYNIIEDDTFDHLDSDLLGFEINSIFQTSTRPFAEGMAASKA